MTAAAGQTRRLRPALAWLLSGLLGVITATRAAAPVPVAAELARLKAEQGFQVKGEEVISAEATGRAEGEDIYRRLRRLLEGFDHIIVQGGSGRVERVIILGAANPNAPQAVVSIEEPAAAGAQDASGPIELPTIRSGNSHSVKVTLEGADGRRIEQVLLIDTGADAVVLPASLIPRLGIASQRLSERQVQTANGPARARMGRLPAILLDGHRVAEVEVAFLDDIRLGSAGLLGMSVLGRYQMTIDDANSRLTLQER